MSNTIFFQFGKRKYPVALECRGKTTRVFCEAINIDQDFLSEDVPALIADLPNIFAMKFEHRRSKVAQIQFRVSGAEKLQIEKKARQKGLSTIEFLRRAALSE